MPPRPFPPVPPLLLGWLTSLGYDAVPSEQLAAYVEAAERIHCVALRLYEAHGAIARLPRTALLGRATALARRARAEADAAYE